MQPGVPGQAHVMQEVRARTELGDGPTAVRAVRREVRRVLSGRLVDDDLETALLLVSELVTNAALHVGGPVSLGLCTRSDVLRIEVHDGGGRLPVPRRALDRERTSGRGLHLVQQLAEQWGAEPEPGGKVVWCEVRLRSA